MLTVIALKTVFILLVVVGAFAPVITWVERKQSALMQDRIGANRASVAGVSVLGLLHPAADVLKLLSKEDFLPRGADRMIHRLAPIVAAVPAIVAFAVIPFGGHYRIGEYEISLVAADIDWGVLFVFAAGSLGVYGAVLAGWSSNNNWSMLGGVRATAQMISYEVTLGLTLVPIFMVFETLRLTDISSAQDATLTLFGFLPQLGFDAAPRFLDAISIPRWGIFLNPPAFLMFLTCVMAENKRPPFDLPESESELVAGYLTEYSGMRFGLFYMSEFIQVVVIGGLVTAIFLGGWSIPWLPQSTIIGALSPYVGEGLSTLICMALHVTCFFSKLIFVIWIQMLIRWSLPRFRYDQVMNLCWKVILPASLLNVFVTAFVLLALGGDTQ